MKLLPGRLIPEAGETLVPAENGKHVKDRGGCRATGQGSSQRLRYGAKFEPSAFGIGAHDGFS